MEPHPITGDLFASPVPPGTGWPEDPAESTTLVARSAGGVRRLARASTLSELEARTSVCGACPRLVAWRAEVSRTKRASYADQPYWGRPAPGWGAEDPAILIVGLAPAAHGANRTGRVFTGDSSGDWLFASLHRTGLAVQERSDHAGDGQRLIGARIVAAVRCAPPENKPTPEEQTTCRPWLVAETALLRESLRVVVCLGAVGWSAALATLAELEVAIPRPRPRFGHGAEVRLETKDGRTLTVLGSYHPSQHNTFTGRLTPTMLDDVFRRAGELAAG